MKKIVYVFCPFLIAFLLGFLFTPLYCSASAAPELSQQTLDLIINGNNSLTYDTFSVFDNIPLNRDPTAYYNMFAAAYGDPLIQGASLNAITANDYTVTALTSEQIENVSSDLPYLYDSFGNAVQWEDVYYVHYMNGMFHGDLYVDRNGNVLTSDSAGSKWMFQMGLGGALLGANQLANIYSDIASQIENNELCYALDGVDLTSDNYSYYLYGGVRSGRKLGSFVVYVPNVYNVGVAVGANPTNGQCLHHIYCNSLDDVLIKQINNGYGTPFVVTTGNYSYGGQNYTYDVQMPWVISSSSPTDKEAFFDTSRSYSTVTYFNLSATNFSYDTSLYESTDIVAFKELQPLPATKRLQFDDTYDYSYISELEQALNNSSVSPNELFDPSQSISEFNYPFIIEVPQNTPNVTPSSLVFPSSSPNPSPGPAPSLIYDPSIAPEITPDSMWNFNIPIIQNLHLRFPFSIPWDIYHFLQRLNGVPTPPAWNFDWTIHVLGHDYTYHCEGDLSDYNGLAEILRALELIAFVFGLMQFSYNFYK